MDARVDHALAGDDGLRLLELDGRPRPVHRRRARLPVTQPDRDQKGQGQRDPDPLAQHDVVIAQRPALDGLVLGAAGRLGFDRDGLEFSHGV